MANFQNYLGVQDIEHRLSRLPPPPLLSRISQAILIVLLEEKAQAETRAAEASDAADRYHSEIERTKKEADEAVRAAERKADTLKADLKRQANTNAQIGTVSVAAAAVGPAVESAVESSETNRRNSCEAGHLLYDKPNENRTVFHGEFDEACEAVRMAEARVVTLTDEIDRVNDKMAQIETTAAKAREGASVDIAEAKRCANEESARAKLAAMAAAERAATAETKFRETKTALREAKKEADRLRVQVERAQAEGEVVRSAAQEERGSATDKIAHLEGVIQAKETENTRSRDVVRALPTEVSETAASAVVTAAGQHGMGTKNCTELTVDLANGVENATEDVSEPAAASPEVTPPAVSITRARQQQQLAEMEIELRVAETAVVKATEEVDFLRRELDSARAAEMTSAVRRDAAESRIVELEREMSAVEKEHMVYREGVESRLEVLRASFAEEELESGAQVGENTCGARLDHKTSAHALATDSVW